MKRLIKFSCTPVGCVVLKFWQMPQIVLGIIVQGIYMLIDKTSFQYASILTCSGNYPYVVSIVVSKKMSGGLSLGDCIILNNAYTSSTLLHESGHCLQSMLLGWFYLPIIGLSSIIWASWHILTKSKRDYNSFWTERWADSLAHKYIS